MRTTLRRAVPSFTVEVRRRSRLATTSNPDAPSSETKSPLAAFDRNSHRAVAAAFDEKIVDRSSVDVGASPPRGRILPSLVPDAPRHRLLEDSPCLLQTLSHLRGHESEGLKHPNRRGTRTTRLTRVRRWLRDWRPHPVERPSFNQMNGQGLRPVRRRVRQVRLSETPAVLR